MTSDIKKRTFFEISVFKLSIKRLFNVRSVYIFQKLFKLKENYFFDNFWSRFFYLFPWKQIQVKNLKYFFHKTLEGLFNGIAKYFLLMIFHFGQKITLN